MDERPMLRVVRGDPTDEELAALIAVVTARTAASSSTPEAARSAWNHPRRLVREPVYPGPDGWVASARPR